MESSTQLAAADAQVANDNGGMADTAVKQIDEIRSLLQLPQDATVEDILAAVIKKLTPPDQGGADQGGAAQPAGYMMRDASDADLPESIRLRLAESEAKLRR